MLNIIGLGLNLNNITEEIKKTIKESEKVYLESYTSYFYEDIKKIEEKLDTKIIALSRKELEQNFDYEECKEKKVSLLIIGDIFSATTHSEIYLTAKKKKIEVKLIHNVSIINAITDTGLEYYKFGKTASIVFPRKNWLPKTPYKILEENKKINAHTLFLLDIITTEEEIKQLDTTRIGEENIEKQIIKTYDNNKMLLMTPNQAIKTLLKIQEKIEEEKEVERIREQEEENKKENKKEKTKLIDENTKIFVCSRLQTKNEKIITGTIKELQNYNFGQGPHCIIMPSKMHFIEEEFYELYNIKNIKQ